MNTIGIIGAGFSGTMTAVHLIRTSSEPLEIILFDRCANFNKGIAYSPYSDKHLLNVITAKMSAFAEEPDHFLNWVMQKKEFCNKDRSFVANAFLPRRLYGAYLSEIWRQYLEIAKSKGISIKTMNYLVSDLDILKNSVEITLDNNTKINVHKCVLATGNQLPRNPKIRNMDFYKSSNYFQNPWKIESVQNTNAKLPVLIVGNGLTMVDTVLSLLENGHKSSIYALSPNGFNILPHRHGGIKYQHLTSEITTDLSLYDLFKLVKKHVQNVRSYGVSAEPIVDSLRPYAQQFWKSFSDNEKQLFMKRLRHLWGVARHRIPINSHDKIQQLRIEGKLKVISGNLIDIHENDESIAVDFINRKLGIREAIGVSRVINCTGPESDINKMNTSLLKNGLKKGVFAQDPLALGINTNCSTYQVLDSSGKEQSNLFTLGSHLRGELWESTAVNELRVQAESLAKQLINGWL